MRLVAVIVAVALALGAVGAAAAEDPGATARGALLAEFATHRLVAFGEEHQDQRQHAFLRALVRDPRFAAAVDDVVVEFGNARYQRLVDRWTLNRTPGVTLSRVRRAWLDTTQGRVWSDPVYEAFFRAVRAANMRLDPAERVRVLLGDPPIVWSRVRTRQDYERRIGRRGPHYVSVVERHVLARGRRALLVAGGGHLLRDTEHAQNETGVLEARHGRAFVILPQPSSGVDEGRWRRPSARCPRRRCSRSPARRSARGRPRSCSARTVRGDGARSPTEPTSCCTSARAERRHAGGVASPRAGGPTAA